MSSTKPLRIGLIGAGIGGVAAACSLKHNGGDAVHVTILEAAPALGEIGAGIQMTPNVARLLIRWGVSDIIGDNLVDCEEVTLRRKDGTVVGRTEMRSLDWCGVPWWLVHRMHLHDGLSTAAKQKGVEVIINARVSKIDYQSGREVNVTTEAGGSWTFDVVIGSDGLNSVVRKMLLPDIKPKPPSGNAAYRAIVPMEKLKSDPLTKDLVRSGSMNLWLGAKKGSEHGYIITYPISGGKDFNMVLSHHRNYHCETVEIADLEEVKKTYKDYDPSIRRVIDMIDQEIKRWPLMVTRCPTWSNSQKNIVLMGDAAHSMVNHMAQGAATSMEDGAFLGIVLSKVARKELDLRTAIDVYEKERMPLADLKQQVSYINGLIYHTEDDTPDMYARDKALEDELQGKQMVRSPNLYTDPWAWRTIYEYDPEAHAMQAVSKLQNNGEDFRDPTTHVTTSQADIYLNWFKPSAMEKAPTAKL